MNQPKVMQPPMRLPEVSPKVQPHGLPTIDGTLTTEHERVLGALETAMIPDPTLKTLGETLPALPSQNGSQQQTNTSPSTHNQADKNELAKTLAIVCALQKQYGKTPAEFELLVEGFSRVLKYYPMKQIIEAIDKFTLKNPGIPSPADIETIINPPLPKIDWPFYITLNKKRIDSNYNYYLSPEEKQFMRNCEDLAILRQRGEMENYDNAQRQIEQHKALMITSDGDAA